MASSALVVADASAAAIITASGFDRAQVELVKSTVAVGATDMELALFLQTAKHRGLDVFARQIHFVKRRQKRNGEWVEVGTMQTGIDGFRLIADRTGKYDGQDEAEFEYADPNRRAIPYRATVRVYRKDMTRPISGTAYWAEYADTFDDGNPRGMWKKMPHLMLAKTAEALALRKAFPENLSGLYTDDEMPPPIEAEAVVHEQQSSTRPTGTVTRLRDRVSEEARAETPPVDVTPAAATTDEIPPAGSDAATLRAWLGRRLAIAAKSWTGEHMAIACAEVNQALALPPGTVTPRTLSSHLAAYRDAIAGDSTQPSATPDMEVPDAAETSADAESGANAPASNVIHEIATYLSAHAIANDDAALQESVAAITKESESGVRNDWRTLDVTEMMALLVHLHSLDTAGE